MDGMGWWWDCVFAVSFHFISFIPRVLVQFGFGHIFVHFGSSFVSRFVFFFFFFCKQMVVPLKFSIK
jgi:hypothetical protein